MATYFCDGLKEVTILNGVARLEFQRFETVEQDGNRELRPTTELVVALPIPGLVSTIAMLEKVRERLIGQGGIGPNGTAVPSPAPEPARSPNFP